MDHILRILSSTRRNTERITYGIPRLGSTYMSTDGRQTPSSMCRTVQDTQVTRSSIRGYGSGAVMSYTMTFIQLRTLRSLRLTLRVTQLYFGIGIGGLAVISLSDEARGHPQPCHSELSQLGPHSTSSPTSAHASTIPSPFTSPSHSPVAFEFDFSTRNVVCGPNPFPWLRAHLT